MHTDQNAPMRATGSPWDAFGALPLSGTPVRESPNGLSIHPEIEQVRRLLSIAPDLERLDIAEGDVRIIAGLHATRRLAEEAAERLIRLLDELGGDPDLEPSLGYMPPWVVLEGEGEDDNGIGDRDGVDPDAEGDGDGEPSLVWSVTASARDQRPAVLAIGDYDNDREHDTSYYEPNGDEGDGSRFVGDVYPYQRGGGVLIPEIDTRRMAR